MINLPLATDTWSNEEIEAINEVIDSDRFTMGKKVKELEEKFANYFGSEHAIMVNSGSSANLLAIASLVFSEEHDLNRGDEVIVPAVSWATTFTPLQQYGLKIKFVDIDLHTLNLNIDLLEQAITKKTKAIFAVNLLGNPLNYSRLIDIVEKNNLILIEDNCESMGAKFKNKYTGTFGELGTFSTFFSHHISTMEGGIITTDNPLLKDIILSLRAHGWTRNLPNDSDIYKKKENDFYESFNFILPGYNVRPLEMEAAIGLKQLNKLNKIIGVRRKNGKHFGSLFQENKNIIIQKEIGESSFFGFSMVISKESDINRDELIEKLKFNEVECRPIVAGNFTKNDVIKYFDYEILGELSNADYIHNNGLFIGNHHYDISEKLDQVYNLIEEIS
jgi:CDP-6-deoxy-D-xylo-4-hexulose-3-dehydrase